MLLVAHGLRVIALHPAAHAIDQLGIGIGEVDLARGRLWRRERVRRATEAPAILHHPARPVGLIALVAAPLIGELLLQALLGLQHPALAGAGDRLTARRAFLIEPLA